MPRPFTIETKLPIKIRKQLERRLTDRSFSSYRELERWLKGLGYPISCSVLCYWGARFLQRQESVRVATAQARAVVEATAGDEDVAMARLVQERLFNMLVDTTPPLSRTDLIRFSKAITDLGRSTLEQSRWTAELQQRLKKQRGTAQQKLSSLAEAGGLSASTVEQIRDLLLGIDPFVPSTASAEDLGKIR
jgi:hypothetical protein